MTFSEYIIQERSRTYYFSSLGHMIQFRMTLEEWFPDLYVEYNILCSEELSTQNVIKSTKQKK